MNIWIVNPFDGIPGEVARKGRYWSLAEELSERGHKVVWWSSSFSHAFKVQRTSPIKEELGFEVILVETPDYSSNIGIKRIVNHQEFGRLFQGKASQLLKMGKLAPPDRMIISVPPLATPGAAFSIRDSWGGKVVLDIQDAWPETFHRLVPGNGKMHDVLARLVFSPIKAIASKAYRNADAMTSVAWTYLRLKGVPQNVPKHMTPIGTGMSELTVCQAPKASPITFLYLGSMSKSYDLETIVRASALLKSQGHMFKVVLAGLGPKEKRLKELAIGLGLGDQVQFPGFLDFNGVIRLLGESSVGLNTIFPSSYIAMPNKIADYLCGGLPVINSIPGELQELLQTEEAGTFYEAGQVSTLANAMKQYINSPEKVETQGDNARKLGKRLFDRNVTYPLFADFIENV